MSAQEQKLPRFVSCSRCDFRGTLRKLRRYLGPKSWEPMSLQNTTYTGTARHRAEDDLFHFDRSRAPKLTDCDTGLSSTKASARHWVVSMRPRWLVSLA